MANALLQHVCDRWSIDNSWPWCRNTRLRELAHRYREAKGVPVFATRRSLAFIRRQVRCPCRLRCRCMRSRYPVVTRDRLQPAKLPQTKAYPSPLPQA
jgi:hypothetical protein